MEITIKGRKCKIEDPNMIPYVGVLDDVYHEFMINLVNELKEKAGNDLDVIKACIYVRRYIDFADGMRMMLLKKSV